MDENSWQKALYDSPEFRFPGPRGLLVPAQDEVKQHRRTCNQGPAFVDLDVGVDMEQVLQ